MTKSDPRFTRKARKTISELFARWKLWPARKRAHLVSYPRSGNTLVREFLAILQGRPQPSVYAGDVVGSRNAALTHALDRIDVVKSHQMPADGDAMIYLVRDGRNATLSFLYMSYLFGGHTFSALSEVYDGIRQLDEAEGSWADNVADALLLSESRPTLFVRYEDLVSAPQTALGQIARFLGADVPAEVLDDCIRRQKTSVSYVANPKNGYLYRPPKGSIYDLLKQHRRDSYWRHIFDDRSRKYFHASGATQFLLHFDFERSADWWKE
jgi:hypothetical protein